MASLAVMGFFCLASGPRVMTTKPNNSRVWHAHYTTSIQCADGTALPADLRVYSPMNDVLHADNKFAFVYARAHIPMNDTISLDASHVVPCPGDPDDDDYEDSVPNLPYPFVIGLRHVSGSVEHLPNASRLFRVLTSEFVRDNVQPSNVGCIFDASRPRWKNTNVPYPGTVVQFTGTCTQVLPEGNLAIDIESITLNVPTSGSAPSTEHDNNQNDDNSGSPKKRKKFRAFASNSSMSALQPSTSTSQRSTATLQPSALSKSVEFLQGSSKQPLLIKPSSAETELNNSALVAAPHPPRRLLVPGVPADEPPLAFQVSTPDSHY